MHAVLSVIVVVGLYNYHSAQNEKAIAISQFIFFFFFGGGALFEMWSVSKSSKKRNQGTCFRNFNPTLNWSFEYFKAGNWSPTNPFVCSTAVLPTQMELLILCFSRNQHLTLTIVRHLAKLCLVKPKLKKQLSIRNQSTAMQQRQIRLNGYLGYFVIQLVSYTFM